MKFGILGDLHLRSTKPINRIDNFYYAQFNKLQQAFTVFEQHGCHAILQPGDFFNNYGNDSYELLFDVICFLKKQTIPIYCVLGQHDVRFHNLEIKNTPIQILNEMGLVHIINEVKALSNNVFIYGKSWGEAIPKIAFNNNKTNILLTHLMVIKNKKVWEGQKEYSTTKFMKKRGFHFCICGDNHNAFIDGGVINCGSLTRMSIDQMDHTPLYGIIDTDSLSLNMKHYDIAPSSDVFCQDVVEEKREKIKENSFVANLNADFAGEVSYRDNINYFLKQKRQRKRVKEIIEESLIS